MKTVTQCEAELMRQPNGPKVWAGLAKMLPEVIRRDKAKNGPLFMPKESGK